MAGIASISVDIVGADELRKKLEGSDTFTKQVVADALNKAANDARQKAADLAPHDTGKLKDSLHTEYATPDNPVAKVGTNVVYARAQEFGTVGMVINVPNGRRTKNGGQTRPYSFTGNIKPKLYMTQARDYVRPKLTEYLQQAAQKIVNYFGY